MNTINEPSIFEQLGLSRQPEAPTRKEALGQEDFLDLMVTQLRNQDPLKPMESGEFLGQLAQFGTVSGIDSLEAAFKELSTSLTSNQALQAASIVGRKVLVAANQGPLSDGGTLTGAVELASDADQVSVGVYDSAGQMVRTLELGEQSQGFAYFNWDGLTTDGQPAPAGAYELRAEVRSGSSVEAGDVLIEAQVETVGLGRVGEPLTVKVTGLGSLDFSSIRQIGQGYASLPQESS